MRRSYGVWRNSREPVPHPPSIKFRGQGLFPQGVSIAIRTYVLSEFSKTDNARNNLTLSLIKSYITKMQGYLIINKFRSPPPEAFHPIRCGNIFVQEFLFDVTEDRPLQVIFLFDGFYNYDAEKWAFSKPLIIEDPDINLEKRIKNAKTFSIYFIGALFVVPFYYLLVFLTEGAFLPHLPLKNEGLNIELLPYIFCAIVGASLAVVGSRWV